MRREAYQLWQFQSELWALQNRIIYRTRITTELALQLRIRHVPDNFAVAINEKTFATT